MMDFEVNYDNHTINWLKDILKRCGRNRILIEKVSLFEIRDYATYELIDSDTDFKAIFLRAYDWEEDVPGYEGLLWWSPARCSGDVCLKGTRINASIIAVTWLSGENPLDHWDDITQEQINAAVKYIGEIRLMGEAE